MSYTLRCDKLSIFVIIVFLDIFYYHIYEEEFREGNSYIKALFALRYIERFNVSRISCQNVHSSVICVLYPDIDDFKNRFLLLPYFLRNKSFHICEF